MAHSSRGASWATGASGGLDNPAENPGPAGSVLRDIAPILARIQMRSPQAPAAPLYGMTSSEAVAAVALVGDLAGDSLRRLTAYLDEEADSRKELQHCAPLVASAAQALAARDYSLAFTLIFDCYRTIALLRLADPSLPLPGAIRNPATDGRRADDRRAADGGERETSSGAPH